jgi:hypothetical protein
MGLWLAFAIVTLLIYVGWALATKLTLIPSLIGRQPTAIPHAWQRGTQRYITWLYLRVAAPFTRKEKDFCFGHLCKQNKCVEQHLACFYSFTQVILVQFHYCRVDKHIVCSMRPSQPTLFLRNLCILLSGNDVLLNRMYESSLLLYFTVDAKSLVLFMQAAFGPSLLCPCG